VERLPAELNGWSADIAQASAELAKRQGPLDFCDLSSTSLLGIALVSALVGAAIGYVIPSLFTRSGFDLAASPTQNLAGGCLLPVALSVLSGFGAARFIPVDPCGGAYSSVAGLIPLEVAVFAAIGAIGAFWAKAWHR
jgi:hypothetical protein